MPSGSKYIEGETFQVPDSFLPKLESSIGSLPNGSAPGCDGLYYEMFKVAPHDAATVLNELCCACGHLKHEPNDWCNGVWVPLYKKGDPEKPVSYTPICLLSLARKTVKRCSTIPSSVHLMGWYGHELGVVGSHWRVRLVELDCIGLRRSVFSRKRRKT